MEMTVDFAGGLKVDAHFNGHTVSTDQPVSAGGEGSSPTPFELFLASIGTCAGIFVLGFCKSRGIPTEGIKIVQSSGNNPATGKLLNIDIDIRLPPSFPEKYLNAVVAVAEQCKVKKTIADHPPMTVRATVS